MRSTLIVLAAGALLAIPIVGNVQQVPGESTRRPANVADLTALMEAQTEAIQALHKRVVALESRIKILEDKNDG